MKFLLSSFYNSFYNAEWLRQHRNASGRAWGYFLVLAWFAALVTLPPLFWQWPRIVKEISAGFEQRVPVFEATWKGGQLTLAGFPQPFIEKGTDDGGQVTLVVVDTVTTTPLRLRDFLPDGKANGVLVAKDRVEIYDGGSGQTQTQTWGKFPDYTLGKDTVRSWINWLVTPQAMAVVLLAALTFVFIAFIFSKIFIIGIAALIAVVVAKLFRRAWRYGELFTAGLFAITLPTILVLVLGLAGLRVPYLEFLALVALLISLVITKDKSPAVLMGPKNYTE